ncbi:GumC family protein [Acidicapsa dinghuensis]|uniref:GumC family protein n=1 Tax=Acidicapsa dinghuensis TaxID=2218256 RepID=A0ABW1EF74_9BACT|nr:hypothetical protein [Acidicapsa dinghuensis]
MHTTATNNPEPRTPTSAQYPLRPAAKANPFRINVFKSVRFHPVATLLVTLLILGLGLAVIASHKPFYVATSVIYVSPTNPKTLVDDRELDRPYDSYIQEVMRDVTQYSVLAETLHRLPPGVAQFPDESERSAVTRLQQSLNVERIGQTYQVAISISGARPEHLADIVNTLTSAYVEKAKSDEFYGRDERLSALKAEQARIQNETDSLLQEQNQISRALGVASVTGKDAGAIDTENSTVQSELIAAHQQRIEAEAALQALTDGDPSAPNSALSAAADEIIANDPELQTLRTDLSKHQADLVGKLNGMTENHPERKQTEAQLAQINKALQDMQNNLRQKAAAQLEQKLRTKLNQAQMIESRLNADLQRGTRQAVDTAPKLQRAQEIQAELTQLGTRYAAVDERMSNIELESTSPGAVHLFSPAMTPLTPERSKIRAMIVVIFPFAILAGLATAILLELLDPRVYNATDVEAVLGFAPIGMLFDDREVNQVVFDECALRLAAGVEHASRNTGAKTFVITAVNSGAGTTSIVEHLGTILAKMGRKALAIDPSGNSDPISFAALGSGLEKKPVALGAASSTSLATTNAEASKLTTTNRVLPSKLAPVHSLGFEGFQRIAAEYDIVLIDAAPALISAETEYLARMADVTVLVVEAGKTRKAWLTRAARLLERLGIAGAAAIVNKVHPARAEEALKEDLREFELRSDRINLQQWWKPAKNSTRTDLATLGLNGNDNHDGNQKNEEDVVYARNIS